MSRIHRSITIFGSAFLALSLILILCGLSACQTAAGNSLVKLSLVPAEVQILEGDTLSPDVQGLGKNQVTEAAVWFTEDPTIAVFSPTGLLIALKEGTTVGGLRLGGQEAHMSISVSKPMYRLENIWIGKTLFEKDGKALYGNVNETDPSAQWVMEANGKLQRLRNKATGNYLNVKNEKDWVEILPADNGMGEQWKVVAGSINGGTTFESALFPSSYLHVEGKKGFVQCDESVQASWTSPQWKLIKVALPDPNAKVATLDSLVRNGSFSLDDPAVIGIAGLKGTSYWVIEGDGLSKVALGLDGSLLRVKLTGNLESGAVRLSQAVSGLKPSLSYLVSFDASTDDGRSIALSLGGSGQAMPITLSNGMGHYGFIVTTATSLGNAPELQFLLGGKAGQLAIAQIRLEPFDWRNIVRNGNFKIEDQDGQHIQYVENSAGWFFGTDQGGGGGAAVPINDNGELKVNIIDAGKEVYGIQLIQSPLTVVKGVQYHVSLTAHASAARTINVKVGGVADRNWADYTRGDGVGKLLSIDTTPKAYGFDFIMNDETDHAARLEFQLGGSLGQVWLDNISVVPVKLVDGSNAIAGDNGKWQPSLVASKFTTPVSRGAQLPFVDYQAEAATTNASIIGPDRAVHTVASEAVGRQAVKLQNKGDFVEFTLSSAADSLLLRYCIPDSTDGKGQSLPLGVWINGKKSGDLILDSSYAWVYGAYPWTNEPSDGGPRKFFDEATLRLSQMKAGTKVRLQKDTANDAAYYIDLLDAELVPPALTQPADSLSVLDFGAIPDDGKDDQIAIQKCLDTAAKQGKIAWLPPGRWEINAESELYLDKVSFQGAGMWYSTLSVGKHCFYGSGKTFLVSDVKVEGHAKQRDDQIDEDGFRGNAGSNSRFERVWFNRLKVGIWTERDTTALTVDECRFRNTLADGINLCLGTKDSVVSDCHFRGTGDDAVAIWSAQYKPDTGPCTGNTIRNNTIESPWLANGIALYGGRNHLVENNLVSDTIFNGAGITLSSSFDPVPYSGSVTIRHNSLIRCGSPSSRGVVTPGAFWFWVATNINADIQIQDLQIVDASFAGISIEGRGILKQAFLNGATVDGSGSVGIKVYSSAQGSAQFSNVHVAGNRLEGSQAEGGFKLEKTSGNTGW